jgi:hypothetical protein
MTHDLQRGDSEYATWRALSGTDSLTDKITLLRQFGRTPPPVLSFELEAGTKLFVATSQHAAALEQAIANAMEGVGQSDSINDKLVLLRRLGFPVLAFRVGEGEEAITCFLAEAEQARGIQEGLDSAGRNSGGNAGITNIQFG